MTTARLTDSLITFTVPPETAHQSLTDVVADRIGQGAAQTVLSHGGVWLERRRALDGSQPVAPGMQVTIHRPPAGCYGAIMIDAADICYEDRWLLALNKRQGWYTTPTPWDVSGNVRAALQQFVQSRDGADAYIHLVHQLDRDTSGVLLCSKDPAVNGELQQAFNAGSVAKEYLCICAGEPKQDVFEVQSGHGRGRSGLWRLYPREAVGDVLPNGSRVKFAHTGFAVVQRLSGAALLRATLHTGRTHQIRLHLATRGHPLLGDRRYGGPETFVGHTLEGHLLHAACMRLRHPITYRPLEVRTDLPRQMATILAAAT